MGSNKTIQDWIWFIELAFHEKMNACTRHHSFTANSTETWCIALTCVCVCVDRERVGEERECVCMCVKTSEN